jgi:hypothetical protein
MGKRSQGWMGESVEPFGEMTPRANCQLALMLRCARALRVDPARRVFVAVGKLGNPCQLAGILEGVLRL